MTQPFLAPPGCRGYTIKHGKSIQCIIFLSPCSLISHVFIYFTMPWKISVNAAYCEGQRVMGLTDHMLGKLLLVSPEDKCFVDILVFLQSCWWRHGRWWTSLIAFPHCLSFSIFCGRLHLCGCTLQMTKPFCQCWGGVTPKQFKNIFGQWSSPYLTQKEWWWVLTTVSHPSLPTPHLIC